MLAIRSLPQSDTYHVKEGEVLLGLDQLRKLLPLLLSGVDTGGVLSTRVEQELRFSRSQVEKSWLDIRPIHLRLSDDISLLLRGEPPNTTTYLDILLHTLKVESDGLLVKVPVPDYFKSASLDQGDMVSPSGLGQVNFLWAGEVRGQETGSDPQGSSTRDRLGHGDLHISLTRLSILQ